MCLILLALAGCEDRGGGPEPSPEAGAEQNLALEGGLLPSGAADPAKLQALIDKAMPAVLPNAKAARYRDVRAGAGGAACGEVAAGSAIFRPFVVTPEGVAVVATGAAIAYDDPNDIFADAWIRWCATPEELQRLAPQLQKAADANIADLVPPPDMPVPDVPIPLPQTEEAPRSVAPARPAPPPQIDSFFNSVQRKEE
jgi:hypothetical protein